MAQVGDLGPRALLEPVAVLVDDGLTPAEIELQVHGLLDLGGHERDQLVHVHVAERADNKLDRVVRRPLAHVRGQTLLVEAQRLHECGRVVLGGQVLGHRRRRDVDLEIERIEEQSRVERVQEEALRRARRPGARRGREAHAAHLYLGLEGARTMVALGHAGQADVRLVAVFVFVARLHQIHVAPLGHFAAIEKFLQSINQERERGITLMHLVESLEKLEYLR